MKSYGFTLIEVAILLVIIGLISVGGLTVIRSVVDSQRLDLTANRLDLVEHAIQTYVEVNGCLPCPADGALVSTAANAGLSQGNSVAYTSGCAGAQCDISANAVVPWRTLGIAEDQASDGWGNRMRFDVADTADTASPCGLEVWANNGMNRCTAGYPSGGIDMTDNDGVFGTINGFAYVLLSNGPDRSLAITANTGTATADVFSQTGGALDGQEENFNGDETYAYGDPIDLSDATHFDDIVRYKTAPIIVQLCGPGTCGNPE